MARPRNVIPTYRRHKKTGRAVVTVRGADGERTDMLLPGPYGSDESRAEYERLLALLRTHEGTLPPPKSDGIDPTINELALAYLDGKVTKEYIDTDTGKPTHEAGVCRVIVRVLVRLFGSTLVREFDSTRLETVQRAMASGSWMTDEEKATYLKQRRPIGWCRSNVNRCITRLRSIFRWGVRRKLVPAAVLVDIATLEPLKRGRSGARESELVAPVELDVVEATIPKMPSHVGDMVRVQLLTGARPGEICAMQVGGLDVGGPVWFYRPDRHKTLHYGHTRAIAIGPQAQLILRKYLTTDLDAFLFSPVEQRKIINEAKRRARKSKVQPSQVDRSKPGVKRRPGLRFTVTGYNRAVGRACQAAGVTPWHVHQLRHTAALLVAREHGAEAARATLGHKTINMTAHYAGIDQKRAAEVAATMG